MFDRALEAIDKGSVVLVTTTPSPTATSAFAHRAGLSPLAPPPPTTSASACMSLYQVVSSMPGSSRKGGSGSKADGSTGRTDGSHGGGAYDAHRSGVDSRGYYTVLPHYCTCADFSIRVLSGTRRKWVSDGASGVHAGNEFTAAVQLGAVNWCGSRAPCAGVPIQTHEIVCAVACFRGDVCSKELAGARVPLNPLLHPCCVQCKHLLAVSLADAIGKYTIRHVSREEMRSLVAGLL